jgi:hypothetical protein
MKYSLRRILLVVDLVHVQSERNKKASVSRNSKRKQRKQLTYITFVLLIVQQELQPRHRREHYKTEQERGIRPYHCNNKSANKSKGRRRRKERPETAGVSTLSPMNMHVPTRASSSLCSTLRHSRINQNGV